MNNIENLLVTVSEECAELQQAVAKALRFGLDNHDPYTESITNKDDIIHEFYQLTAMVEYLQVMGELPTYDESMIETIKEVKIKNIKKWQEVSKKEGTLGK